jgi:hypothetical protein
MRGCDGPHGARSPSGLATEFVSGAARSRSIRDLQIGDGVVIGEAGVHSGPFDGRCVISDPSGAPELPGRA